MGSVYLRRRRVHLNLAPHQLVEIRARRSTPAARLTAGARPGGASAREYYEQYHYECGKDRPMPGSAEPGQQVPDLAGVRAGAGPAGIPEQPAASDGRIRQEHQTSDGHYSDEPESPPARPPSPERYQVGAE